MLSNITYDMGKKLVQVWLPATGALYFGLDSIWGLPAVEEILGTLAVLETFLGLVLGVSSKQYQNSDAAYDGKVHVNDQVDGPMQAAFELFDDNPRETMSRQNALRFKVVSGSTQTPPELLDEDLVNPE